MSYNGSAEHKANLAKARAKAATLKAKCTNCSKEFSKAGIANHERSCRKKRKICPVCGKKFHTPAMTCSHGCANTYFRSNVDHPNWKESAYRTTCFHYHKKECVVCGENKLVEVHHLDEDNTNNKPSNLIPLCPTHHQYWHSRYKNEVYDIVIKYIADWKEKNMGV